jgi:3alpha(or 20beta)-hydroxysteroid dehydrogenase
VNGRVVVITGAAGGQGAAAAEAAVAAGAVVHVVDREPGPAAPGTTRHTMDVTDAAAWAVLAGELKAAHGTVHGLVANAGVTWRARLAELDPADLHAVLDVNLVGPLLGIQHLTPLMGAGASIVTVGSVAALTGHYPIAYTTSKWALRGLSRVATLEYGSDGIRVNCLFPGYIDTPMVRTASPTFRERSVAEIPIGRLGTVDDIAPLVVFLMSDESTYITGAEISVDGGEQSHGGTKIYSDLARGT